MAVMRRGSLFIALTLAISLAHAPPLQAGPSFVRRVSSWVAPARARSQLVKACGDVHRQLYAKRVPTPLGVSENLTNTVAKSKHYGDSWTCNASSTLLVSALKKAGYVVEQHSSGNKTFKWGSLGMVDYHYYAVDNVKRPRVLFDPVAFPNFRAAAQPSGQMRQWLAEAAQARGRPELGAKLADRIWKGKDGELFVVQGKTEIAIYQSALEKAANLFKSRRTPTISQPAN
jgi:hypothetical protein